MSFNNRPATDALPFLNSYLAPGARMLGPVLSQLATSPLRSTFESYVEMLRGEQWLFC